MPNIGPSTAPSPKLQRGLFTYLLINSINISVTGYFFPSYFILPLRAHFGTITILPPHCMWCYRKQQQGKTTTTTTTATTTPATATTTTTTPTTRQQQQQQQQHQQHQHQQHDNNNDDDNNNNNGTNNNINTNNTTTTTITTTTATTTTATTTTATTTMALHHPCNNNCNHTTNPTKPQPCQLQRLRPLYYMSLLPLFHPATGASSCP